MAIAYPLSDLKTAVMPGWLALVLMKARMTLCPEALAMILIASKLKA
jgi:hypothetical protein